MEENDQTQAGPHMCRKGCGFYGSPNFDGFCSKCHRDMQEAGKLGNSVVGGFDDDILKSTPKASVSPSSQDSLSTGKSPSKDGRDDPTKLISSAKSALASANETDSISGATVSAIKSHPRCMMCNKRVGLTGFTCRCGGLYCTVHRYSDTHDCSFNYRESGQADIRKANPQVICSKINKI